ncbi:uncharacterized [Tachysurus ichikawai]
MKLAQHEKEEGRGRRQSWSSLYLRKSFKTSVKSFSQNTLRKTIRSTLKLGAFISTLKPAPSVTASLKRRNDVPPSPRSPPPGPYVLLILSPASFVRTV